MRTVVEEWSALFGKKVRSDPKCQMFVGGPGNDRQCDLPATVRVNKWPYWSEFWCPEHAAIFDDPPMGDTPFLQGIDIPTFLRRSAQSS